MKIIKIENGIAKIFVPYHPVFVKKMEQNHFTVCDGSKQIWFVSPDNILTVRAIMVDVFGESDIPAAGKRYDVQLTFRKDVTAPRDGLCIYGKCLAYELHESAGAVSGAGVCYVRGGYAVKKIAKERCIEVKAGTIVMLYDVPEGIVQREAEQYWFSYNLIERSFEREEQEQQLSSLDCDAGSSLVPETPTSATIAAHADFKIDSDESELIMASELEDYFKSISCGKLLIGENETSFYSWDCKLKNRWPHTASIRNICAELEHAGWRGVYHNGERIFYHSNNQIAFLQFLQNQPKAVLDELYGRCQPHPHEIQAKRRTRSGYIGYIHFGEIPDCGYTLNVKHDAPELGVSCFEAEIMRNGDYRLINLTPALRYLIMVLERYTFDEEDDVCIVDGDLIGWGTYGQPLLEVSKWEPAGDCVGPTEIVDFIVSLEGEEDEDEDEDEKE